MLLFPTTATEKLNIICFLFCRLTHTHTQLGYSEDKQVVGAHEYDKAKEKAGFVAGKHIHKKTKWWFQKSSKKDWVENNPSAAASEIHGDGGSSSNDEDGK